MRAYISSGYIWRYISKGDGQTKQLLPQEILT